MKTVKKNQKGFTIIELVIASSVFGVILLIAMTGILYIGRSYYKSIVNAKTQDTTRSIIQEVSNTFQYGGADSVTTPVTANYSGFDVSSQCIGNFRYSYVIGARVGNTNTGTSVPDPIVRHALWLDVKQSSKACLPLDITQEDPADSATDTSDLAKAQTRELLPANMRLDSFSFNQPPGRSFMNVSLHVIYGERDLSPSGTCITNNQGGQFCANSELSTTVKKRL